MKKEDYVMSADNINSLSCAEINEFERAVLMAVYLTLYSENMLSIEQIKYLEDKNGIFRL